MTIHPSAPIQTEVLDAAFFFFFFKEHRDRDFAVFSRWLHHKLQFVLAKPGVIFNMFVGSKNGKTYQNQTTRLKYF